MAKYQNDYPDGAVPISASSGNVAAATAAATLTCPAGKTMYLTGFKHSSGGATAASVVTGTVTGVVGGPMSFTTGAALGVGVLSNAFDQDFTPPLAGSATGTNIVVSVPTLGLGNTNSTVSAYGYYL